MPAIDTVELTPEDDAIFPEEFLDGSRIHRVEIIDRTDMRTESVGTPTSDEGDFADREFFPYCLDLIGIPDDRRAIGLMKVTKHFCPYSRIGYTDRHRNPDIMIDRHLEIMGELFILIGYTTHGGEGLIDRKYFELSETGREIAHKSLGYFTVEGVIRMLLHEVFSDDTFRFPKGSSHTYTETFRLIARGYRDLISYDNRLSLQTRISQDLTRCIK